MRRMKDLLIAGGKITDAGLANFDDMPDLRDVSICMNQVTPEGIERWRAHHAGARVTSGPGGLISQ
jgi:hypothetical protein